MAISATQIATSNTLENFRQQYNNLQTDVNGLESGTLTFSSVSATTLGTSALNILEDGTIVFEGATDDGNETTLTVADPSADRTITLPDASGTVQLTGSSSLTVADDGTIGSSSDTDAIAISAAGVQMDNKNQDGRWDAIWESEVVINREGWFAEFKIPFAALRFSN